MSIPVRSIAAALAVAAAQTTSAQTFFDVERLRLDPAAHGSLVVGDGEVLRPQQYRLALTAHYERSPLVLLEDGTLRGRGLFADGDVASDVLKDRLTLHLDAAVALLSRVELLMSVPIVAWQDGDGDLDGAGLATPALGLRVGALVPSDTQPYAVAIAADVSPEWIDAMDLGGNEGITVRPRVEVGRRATSGGWLVAAQVGGILRTERVRFTNGETLEHEATAGVAWATTARPLRLEASVRGTFNLDDLSQNVELLGGARYALGKTAELYALAGPGFLESPGTPTFRGLVGLAFTPGGDEDAPAAAAEAPPPPPPADPCAPGQAQPVEQCPDLDADGDGVPNGQDRCPREPGVAGAGGCAPRDGDGDGVPDHEDRCPREAGQVEHQGCKPPDGDGDGVVDAEDRCPDRPGVPAEGGCPPARAEIKQGRIDIREKVFFDSGRDTIQARSHALLDDVAALLVANTGVTGVEIQGHTDDRGAADFNKALSQRRADAVKAYLVSKGVDAGRLAAVGYGEEQPAEPNTTAAGRDANRRVEFVIRGVPQP